MTSGRVMGERLLGTLATVSALAIVVTGAGSAFAAPVYPYCAVTRGADMSYEECSFASLQECQAEVVGLRGYCQPNPRYVAPLGRAGSADEGRVEQPRRLRRPRD